jgi:hypothetical protein
MQINIHELLNESKLKIFNKWLSVHLTPADHIHFSHKCSSVVKRAVGHTFKVKGHILCSSRIEILQKGKKKWTLNHLLKIFNLDSFNNSWMFICILFIYNTKAFLPFWRISILEEHKICPFTLKVCPTALLTTLEHLWLKWIWSAGVNDIDVQKNKQEVLELPPLATPVSNW